MNSLKPNVNHDKDNKRPEQWFLFCSVIFRLVPLMLLLLCSIVVLSHEHQISSVQSLSCVLFSSVQFCSVLGYHWFTPPIYDNRLPHKCDVFMFSFFSPSVPCVCQCVWVCMVFVTAYHLSQKFIFRDFSQLIEKRKETTIQWKIGKHVRILGLFIYSCRSAYPIDKPKWCLCRFINN